MQIANSNSSSVLPLLLLSATHSVNGLSSRSQIMSTPTDRSGRARAVAQRLRFQRGREQAAAPSVSDPSESDADDRDTDGGHKYDPVIASVAFDEYYKVPLSLCLRLNQYWKLWRKRW